MESFHPLFNIENKHEQQFNSNEIIFHVLEKNISVVSHRVHSKSESINFGP